MNVVDTAKAQVKQIVEMVTDKVGDAAARDSKVQAITIGKPHNEVVQSFADAAFLSQVFGDIADGAGVVSEGPDRLRWTFGSDANAAVALEFRDAPQGRGTEVIAKATGPAPGMLTGALTFKALYRARALLMTGEVPTIEYNPSARDSDR
jgi:hypothetical protein